MSLWELALVALALAWLGACVGSFLNVVVYRLPEGMSLLRPASRCPACGQAIRPWDNVPIAGWLWLRGRCRDCRAAISVRYPLVEALTAGLFVAVGSLSYLEEGGVFWTEIWALSALYHLWLLCTLLCAALIAWDGHRPPGALFAPAVIVGLVVPLWVPDVGWRVWPLVTGAESAGLVELARRLVDSTLGFALGALVLRTDRAGSRGGAWDQPAVWSLALVAMYWSWPAAAALALALAVLQWIAPQRVATAMLIFGGAVLVVGAALIWRGRTIVGDERRSMALLVLCICLAWGAGALARRQHAAGW